jgi:hypothetical protein
VCQKEEVDLGVGRVARGGLVTGFEDIFV